MEDNYRDETWVPGLAKLRLHHINDPSPIEDYIFSWEQPLNFHCNPNFQARVYLDQGQNYSLIRLTAFILLFGIFGLRQSK